jgi:hypothetical protein
MPPMVGAKNQPNCCSFKLQHVEHEGRRRGDVQEQRAEVEGAGQRQQAEAAVAEDVAVAGGEHARVQRQALLRGWLSGSATAVASISSSANAVRNQKIACQSCQPRIQPPTIGAIAWRDTEDHRDVAHQPLRVVALQRIAHDRAADDQADARGQSLQRAEGQQHRQRRGQRAADRGQREHRDADQDHRPPAERVGQRAVHQRHRRVAEQVDADGLLHRHLADGQLASITAKAGKTVSIENGPASPARRG